MVRRQRVALLEISSGHHPPGIILEPNAALEQRGIISNVVKRTDSLTDTRQD